MKMLKKTIVVFPENEPRIRAIMARMKWVEIERVASGGMMSDPILMITYEGYDTDYNEEWYAETKKNDGYSTFYSVLVPNGYYTNDFESFRKVHENAAIHFETKKISDFTPEP